MSGLEKEELEDRTKGATREEQIAIAKCLDDDILLDELRDRYMSLRHKIRNIEETVKE